jgi:hypothetical protein
MFNHHVFLRGGIGNQFFQWAYANKLKNDGHTVKLNTTFLKTRTENQASGKLELLTLFSQLNFPLCNWKLLKPAEFAIRRMGKLVGVLEDDHLTTHPRFFRRLHYGYYQTDGVINNKTLFQAKQLVHIDLMHSKIDGNYCVLHVRAGDYLSNLYNFNNMGLLSVEYQVRAGKILLEKYPNNDLIIVSDNELVSGLVLNVLKEAHGSRVSLLSTVIGRSETQIDAISVMLSAQAISLSNSSFSAMCALLGKSIEVLYPHPWFRAPDLQYISPVLMNWSAIPAEFAENKVS